MERYLARTIALEAIAMMLEPGDMVVSADHCIAVVIGAADKGYASVTVFWLAYLDWPEASGTISVEESDLDKWWYHSGKHPWSVIR